MKKLLALVLAMVMTLGLATVGTGAAYSDAADIDYTEAVDVMTAIEVFDGMDGAFQPDGTLTREQAAKII
ncbi:MAG: S-layer homology domain-containing protein, partial [Oscillospiraceae bacterium]|nr:S-layer homology domain-containing protein [Oscillospiraceae bacterium]